MGEREATPEELAQLEAPAPVEREATPEEVAQLDAPDAPEPMDPATIDKRLEHAFWAAGLGASGANVDRKAQVYKLSRETGAPQEVVDANFDGISNAWSSATAFRAPVPGDTRTPGQRFRESNPELAKLLIERPDLGWVMQDKQVNPLMKALNAASDFMFGPTINDSHRYGNPEAVSEENQRLFDQEKTARDAPKQERVLNDEKAKEFADGWVTIGEGLGVPRRALVPFFRAQETWAQLQISKGYAKLARLNAAGLPTADLESDLLDQEQKAVRRAYNEGPIEQVFSDVAEAAASSAEAVKTGGVAAAAGAVAGGVVGGVVTKNPAGVRAGAMRGASLAGRAGAVYATFELEMGSAYQQMLQARTPDGTQAMDEPTARAAAGIYGVLAAGVEFASWGPMFKAMGPVGALLKSGDTKAFTEALVKSPTFMATLKRVGKNWAGSALAEGGEEGLQDATQQAVEYFARSVGAGNFVTHGTVDLRQSLEAGLKGFEGGMGLAGGEVGLDLVTHSLVNDQAMVEGNKVRALAGLKDSPTAKHAPEVIARLLSDASAESGAPVTHLYVDAKAFTRLFQEQGNPDQAIESLMGPDGPRLLQEAHAQNGRLEVPVEQYIEKWAGGEVATKLLEDTTTSAALLTPRQAKENLPGIAKQAEEIASGAAHEEATASPQFDALEAQLVADGRYSAKQASSFMAPWRALVRTSAEAFKIPAAELFKNVSVRMQNETEAQAATTTRLSQDPLTDQRFIDRVKGMSHQARLEELYVDANTGLLNEKAFDELPAPGGKPLIGHISVEGIKYLNDTVSHDHGDLLYRAVAKALHAVDPLAAKVGGDFAVHVKDQGQLDYLLAKVQKAMPVQGFSITGAIGQTFEAADAAHLELKQKAEAAGTRAKPRQPDPADPTGVAVLPPQRPLGLKSDAGLVFPEARAKAAVPKALSKRIAGLSDEQYLKEAYVDSTGALTAKGWQAIARKAAVAAFDLKGLKAINAELGKASGNAAIEALALAAKHVGGQEFDFAHLHGDEFAAQHDNKVELEAFIARLAAYLKAYPPQVDPLGLDSWQPLAVEFHHGTGAWSYDAADRNLNERKARARQATSEVDGGGSRRTSLDESGSGSSNREGGSEDNGAGSEALGRTRQQQIDSPEFKAWFKESKVVDADGKPTAVFHGTSHGGFDTFTKEFQDPKSPNILFAGDPKNPRGYTDILKNGMERVFKIALTKDADLSTWLHESGHVFLEVFGDLADRPDAPHTFKNDWAETLKWLGVETRGDIKTEHHEKWARGFERYLMEGKSPSPKLTAAFERFKLWLKSVYKNVAALNVELSDEIRSVFDRLLATDAEINSQSKKMGLGKPMAADVMGLSAEAYQEYLEGWSSALTHASRQVELRAMKERLRENDSWWKTEMHSQVDLAEAAYEALPARRVQRTLRGQVVEGVRQEPIGLDRATVVEMIGADAAKGAKLLLKKGGAHPDAIAEQFGYPTGKAMLDALVELPDKRIWSKAAATEAMAETHPDVFTDRQQLREEVGKGLHGDMTEKWLLKEWLALKQKMSPPGTPVWTMQTAPIEAVKMAAKQMVERKVIARLNVGNVLQQERGAADAALKAATKGDYGAAFIAKQEQLLNMYLWRELSQARDQRDAFLDFATALSKDKARERLGKSRPAYRQGVDLVLEALGLRDPGPAEERISLSELTNVMDSDGATIAFDGAEVTQILSRIEKAGAWKPTAEGFKWGAGDYKVMTVAEMRTVDATLRNIKAAATNRATAIYEGKKVDIEELEARLLQESPTNLPPMPPIASSESAATPWQSFGGWVAGIDGSLLRPEVMLKWMGDSWVRAFVDPLQKAKQYEADLLKSTAKPIVEAFEKVPASVRARFQESVDGKALFPNHQVDFDQQLLPPTRRFELLVMTLNAGNESNLSRLLEGRNITMQQLQAAIGLLTKEELDWVQSIWDASEGLWPLASALEERDSGLAPEKLELRALVTNHGTYNGGYFPAAYDRRVEAAGEKAASREINQLLDTNYTRPGTSHGHLKSRVEGFTGVISLEPGTISRTLAQAVHDIAFREAVKSVGGLVLRPAIQAELKRRLGQDRTEQFLQWVKDVGQMRGIDGAVKTKRLLNLVRMLKGNTVVAVLGYSVPTAAGDMANLLAAVPRSGLKLSHWAAGLLQFYTSPFDSKAEAEGKSGELRFRRDQLTRELQKQVKSLTATGPFARGPVRWLKDHAFAFMEFTDLVTSTPIWMGAYRQGLAEQKTEAEAIRFADGVIREVFPSHSPVDLPGVLRDKGYIGTALMFYGYFNVVYNSLRDITHPLHTAEDWVAGAKRAPVVGARALAFMATAVVLSELLSGRGPEGDDEEWHEWFLRKLLVGGFASLPIVGDAATAIESKLMHKMSNPRAAPIVSIMTQIGDGAMKLTEDDTDAQKALKVLMQTLAPPLGLPMSQPLRTATGVSALNEETPRNPFEAGSDMTYGRREGQPKNPLSILGEAISGAR